MFWVLDFSSKVTILPVLLYGFDGPKSTYYCYTYYLYYIVIPARAPKCLHERSAKCPLLIGEKLCSPGLAGENSSLGVVDRSLYYAAPLFLCPPSFPLLPLQPLQNLGWLCWKWNFTLCLLRLPFAPLFLHQWGWDQFNCNTNCH